MILLWLAFSTVVHTAQAADWLSSSAACASKLKRVDLDRLEGNNLEVQRCVKNRANTADQRVKYKLGQSATTGTEIEIAGTCNATYVFLRTRNYYYSQSPDICSQIESARQKVDSANAFAQASAVREAAKAPLLDLIAIMESDLKQAEALRGNHMSLANQTFNQRIKDPNIPASVSEAQRQKILAAQAKKQLDKAEEKKRLVTQALAGPTGWEDISENIAGDYELLRFETQLRAQLPALQKTVTELGGGSSVTSQSERNMGSLGTQQGGVSGESGGSSLRTLANWAPVAVPLAGAGLAYYQSQKQAADASAANALAGLNDPTLAGANPLSSTNTADSAPQSQATLPAAKLRAPLNSTTQADLVSSAASQIAQPNPATAPLNASAGAASTAAASSEDHLKRLEKQFSGSLEKNSALGGFSAAGGSGGGASGNSPERDPAKEKVPAKAGEDGAPMVGGGGGLPGYSGSGSSQSKDDSAIADLFKDPMGATPPAADKGPESDLFGSLFKGSEVETTAVNGQGADVPGATSEASLFTRVRDLHKRCLKKGCVTAEVGGKI